MSITWADCQRFLLSFPLPLPLPLPNGGGGVSAT